MPKTMVLEEPFCLPQHLNTFKKTEKTLKKHTLLHFASLSFKAVLSSILLSSASTFFARRPSDPLRSAPASRLLLRLQGKIAAGVTLSCLQRFNGKVELRAIGEDASDRPQIHFSKHHIVQLSDIYVYFK